jgi:ABC-type antimicrobial peptide transport system permease subunit
LTEKFIREHEPLLFTLVLALKKAMETGQAVDFDARDSRKSLPVAIVNQSLAESLWPNGDPIGSSLIVNKSSAAEVIGVIADVSAPIAGTPRTPEVYLPFWQGRDVNARYCARVAGSPAAALSMLTRVVNKIDLDVPVREAMPMTVRLAQQELRDVRMTEAVTMYGAALAVLLSAIGIYGTLAFSVVNRTKELGVRMAVGASPWDVIDLIVTEEMKVVLAGVVVGLGLAWSAARLFRHLLYGAASGNEVMYAAAALGITAVGLLACSIPAWRAARLDPTTALKAE